jgi:hypothetical protein
LYVRCSQAAINFPFVIVPCFKQGQRDNVMILPACCARAASGHAAAPPFSKDSTHWSSEKTALGGG